MKPIYWKRKAFRKFFLTYASVFLALILLGGLGGFFLLRAQRWENGVTKAEERAARAAQFADEQLDSLRRIRNTLLGSVWVTKLMSDTSVFQEEFDTVRRLELCKELQGIASLDRSISALAVVYPHKRTVVSPQGWFDLQSYGTYLKTNFRLPASLLSETVCAPAGGYGVTLPLDFCYSDSYSLVMAQQLEMIDSPRAIVLIVLNKAYFTETLSVLLGDELRGVSLLDREGNFLLGYGTGEIAERVSVEIASSRLALTIRSDFDLSAARMSRRDLLLFLLGCLLLMILALALSYLLASWSYSPLNRLLARILGERKSGAGTENEYRAVEETFQELWQENRSIRGSMEALYSSARNGLLLRLLKGYFASESLQPQLDRLHLSYRETDWFCVLLLEPEEPGEEARLRLLLAARELLRKQDGSAELVDTLENEPAILLRYEEKPPSELPAQEAQELGQKLAEVLEEEPGIAVSDPHPGLIGISAAYQELREQRASLISVADDWGIWQLKTTGIEYYYPTDWEQQLVSSLKVGDHSTAERILREIQRENENRHLDPAAQKRLIGLVLETVLRVGREAGVDFTPLAASYEKHSGSDPPERLWRIAYNAAYLLCNQFRLSNRELLRDIQNELTQYVNSHYCDSEISLKALGVQFRMSVASASRIFKESTGVNFHEYVTRLRIERSKELLDTIGYDLQRITSAVGYDSEYSFKRAFLRSTGMKPREYMERANKRVQ